MHVSNLWRRATNTTETAAIGAGGVAMVGLAALAAHAIARAIAPDRVGRRVPLATPHVLALLVGAVVVGEAARQRRGMDRLYRNSIAPVREAYFHGWARRGEEEATAAKHGGRVRQMPLATAYAEDLYEPAEATGSDDAAPLAPGRRRGRST